MILKSNIAEVIKKLERIKEGIINASAGGTIHPNFSDAIAGAMDSGMGAMKNRIFNQGLDANGESFGKYIGSTTRVTDEKYRLKKYGNKEDNKRKKVLRRGLKDNVDDGFRYTEYEKKRLAHGRQINKKDLEFNGSLRRSIETVQADNKAQISITNPENAKIAGYQEQQIGNIRATGFAKGSAAPAPIFRLSKEEFETIRKEGNININEVLNNIIKNA